MRKPFGIVRERACGSGQFHIEIGCIKSDPLGQPEPVVNGHSAVPPSHQSRIAKGFERAVYMHIRQAQHVREV